MTRVSVEVENGSRKHLFCVAEENSRLVLKRETKAVDWFSRVKDEPSSQTKQSTGLPSVIQKQSTGYWEKIFPVRKTARRPGGSTA